MWGKDKNRIFFFHEEIKNADPETFETLDWGYSRDKENAYCESDVIACADSETFEISFNEENKTWHGEDKDNLFFCDVDASSVCKCRKEEKKGQINK